LFKEAINKYEGEENGILGQIGRINEKVKHTDGSWFSATGEFKLELGYSWF